MLKSILHHTPCLGHSQRHCALALGVSKGVVAKYLRAAMAAGLDWAAIEPLDEATLQQRLALLIQHECDSRHERRCTRLLQQARLKYPQAAIEDFDARAGRGIERTRLTSLVLSDWCQAGHSVILTGVAGCGKTWLAYTLAQYACRQGHRARYLRAPHLAEELRPLRTAGSYTK